MYTDRLLLPLRKLGGTYVHGVVPRFHPSHEGDLIMENNNTKNTVATYNTEAAEILTQVMTGVDPWQWQTPRVNMSDLLNPKPANDNGVSVTGRDDR